MGLDYSLDKRTGYTKLPERFRDPPNGTESAGRYRSKVGSIVKRVRPSTDVLNHWNIALLFKIGGQALPLRALQDFRFYSQMCQGKHNLAHKMMVSFIC